MTSTATYSVDFHPPAKPTALAAVPGRVPRIVRLLALAHDIERRVRSGELDDLAAAARGYGLTRARVTQIVNLTLLAPAIQETIVALGPAIEGRDTITERGLRDLASRTSWAAQLGAWSRIHGSTGTLKGLQWL